VSVEHDSFSVGRGEFNADHGVVNRVRVGVMLDYEMLIAPGLTLRFSALNYVVQACVVRLFGDAASPL
jgi:hypothetical protein